MRQRVLGDTYQESSELDIVLSALSMKEGRTTDISYVKGIYHIVVPLQVK